jgi:hypothetical protein
MTMTTARETSQARWRLLRAALLGEEIRQEDQQRSIHRFQGFPLIEKRLLRRDALTTASRGVAGTMVVNVKTLDDVETALLEVQCLSPQQSTARINLAPSSASASALPFKTIDLSILRERLASQGIMCRRSSDGVGLEVEWQPSSNEYACLEYMLPTSHVLLIRERLPRRKVSVQALVSQHYHDGVDNTGNARIWDAEVVLVHSMACSLVLKSACGVRLDWDELAVTDTLHVLELGAGMAGMAGLALAKSTRSARQPRMQLTITDGHPDCVVHNQVHVRLNTFPEGVSIKVEKLIWTTTAQESNHVDLLLCSDCTHFQEHHASLAVTISGSLRIGGVAILCQPPRGTSLGNFLTCVTSMGGLLDIQHLTDYNDQVTAHHLKELNTNPCYDPNIHYPQMVVLTKMRAVTHEDRLLAIQHINDRESTSK